ncbi:Hypothetical predicted protein [Paramuricea clavata]|uniref:Uncharacterized protein n=1 Tax=Paramuricea clavata TaxID=317549 RepID=A0A7D9M386_PARCT|nr:Hypothetical predicted protein [Paramuricea clavata]
MAATPRSSSSLPVARRRSSFKSSLSSTSSREGSPPKYFTPRKPAGKITEPRATSSTCKRRSSNPTPTHSAPSSASRRVLRSSGDDSILLSLSPVSKPKSTRKTNRKLIPDNDPPLVDTKSQTIDDLLDCDNTDNILGDVVPIQPKPIAQADLIDLSGL